MGAPPWGHCKRSRYSAQEDKWLINTGITQTVPLWQELRMSLLHWIRSRNRGQSRARKRQILPSIGKAVSHCNRGVETSSKQSRSCERQERKGCLDTSKTVNPTSPTGPGYTTDLHCLHAVKCGHRQEHHVPTISKTMLSGPG